MEKTMMIGRIISGGQTGADQGALDFAIKHGIRHGGWIPKGRKRAVKKAEDLKKESGSMFIILLLKFPKKIGATH